jgi:cytosine/adenosine deaminase-related metal-dependent hydrolase
MIIKCENSAGVYQDDIGILAESCNGDCGCITEVETEDLLKKAVIIVCCAFFNMSLHTSFYGAMIACVSHFP